MSTEFPTNPFVTAPVHVFKVDHYYSTRSICDYDCIITIKVLKRTAKFITVETGGKIKRLGVKNCPYYNCETCEPWGRFSMSPVINAQPKAI